MGVGYAIGNVVLAARAYKNWPEVIAHTTRKREPEKVILKNGIIIQAEVGLRFLVREIFFKRVYNPPYLPIEEDDIVVDIGANNGVFTLYAALNSRKAVHAFEPSPRNLAVLKRNIAANTLHHVTAHGCAVSDKAGVAKLFLNPADGQQNLLSDLIFPDKIEYYKTQTDLNYLIPGPAKPETFIEVPTTTLQAIMVDNHLKQIDFLKLDCEGAEGLILQSTPEAYLRGVKKIAMEFHDHLSATNHEDIQKLLESAGFTTRLKWDNKSPLGYMYAWRH